VYKPVTPLTSSSLRRDLRSEDDLALNTTNRTTVPIPSAPRRPRKAADMSQANIPPAPPHAPQLSAADAPINTFQTSHQTHPASSLPTAFQEAVPITEITPGSSIAAVAALTKPEPALLPPPTQSIQEDDAADDAPITTATSPPTTGSSVHITLLLTTGARHPFTIDQKYLKRRNVGAAGAEVDPFEISVYTMKELIWKDWRDGMFKHCCMI
jgi:hypothetical protein